MTHLFSKDCDHHIEATGLVRDRTGKRLVTGLVRDRSSDFFHVITLTL